MPIPKPNENEKENKFISRCMGDETMKKEFPDIDQRTAVCAKSFKENNKFELKNIDNVEIFSTGINNGDEFTKEDLEKIVETFNETKDELKPFLKLGHSEKQELSAAMQDMPAIGWVENLRLKGKKLVADFKGVPEKIFDLIKKGAYRRVSIELFVNEVISGKRHPFALSAVALLGAMTPAVTSLKDIVSLGFDAEQDKSRVLKKYNYSEKEEKEMSEKELEAKLAQTEKLFSAEQEKVKKFETDLKTKTKECDDLASQKEKLETEVKKFADEKRLTEITSKVEKLIFEKKINPAQKEELISVLNSLPEKKVFSKDNKEVSLSEQILKFATAGKVELNTEGKTKTGKTTSVDEDKEIDEVKKYAKENKISFSDALVEFESKGKLKFAGKSPVDSGEDK